MMATSSQSHIKFQNQAHNISNPLRKSNQKQKIKSAKSKKEIEKKFRKKSKENLKSLYMCRPQPCSVYFIPYINFFIPVRSSSKLRKKSEIENHSKT